MDPIEVKTVTITSKGQIAIPREMRDIEGFREGSKIAVIAYKDRVELRPMKQITKKFVGTELASEKSLARRWNTKEEDDAWKSL